MAALLRLVSANRQPALAGIEALSFDLDDTLWAFRPAVRRAEGVLHRWLLAHAPRTERLLHAPAVLAELRVRAEHEQPALVLAGDFEGLRRASIRAALAACGEDVALEDAAYAAFLAARRQVELYEDVQPALHWLAARFPLVSITNGNGSLAAAGIDGYFRAEFSAIGFGRGKPDAAIFHAAAEAAGVAPGALLHVGDDAALDVTGALGAGLHAAWLVRDGEAPPAWPHGAGTGPTLVLRELRALCQALGGPDTP